MIHWPKASRRPPVVEAALAKRPGLTIIVENYSGFTPPEIEQVTGYLADFPDAVYHSWQAYDGVGKFHITEDSRSPTPHGNLAIRTNNDLFNGEIDERANIRKAVALARKAGLDMTYTYGEYSSDWPLSRGNYEAWAEASR